MKICRFSVVVVVVFLSFPVFMPAQDLSVDRDELGQVRDADIEFESYEGPVERVDSREAIRAIGRTLGEQVRSDGRGVYDERYRVERVLGDDTESGLAADIIELDDGARVDHIENLRRIVSGFLERAWDYGGEDADLLARFVTIYNAVNRGSMTLFEERYRTAVVRALDAERVGLATSYRRWAGETQMVVPIRAERAPGALDAVDPGQLVDRRVIEELRGRTDLGIEDRKAIIEFIERVIEERVAAIDEERQALDQEEQAIEERQAEIEEELSQVAEEVETPEPDQTVDAAPEPAPTVADRAAEEPSAERPTPEPDDATPAEEQPVAQDDEAAVQEPSDAADIAQQDQQEQQEPPAQADPEERVADLEQEQQDLSERQEEIEERREALDEEEAEVQELTERVEELYEETADDQATRDEGAAPRDVVPFVLAEAGGRYELAAVDVDALSIVGEQTVPLADRSTTRFQGGVVAAHRDTGQLLLLDPSTLDVLAESEAVVVPGSRVVAVGSTLLTVIPFEGRYYVGEFDSQLVLLRRSAEPVLAATDIVVRDDRLLVQGEDGRLRQLELSESES